MNIARYFCMSWLTGVINLLQDPLTPGIKYVKIEIIRPANITECLCLCMCCVQSGAGIVSIVGTL